MLARLATLLLLPLILASCALAPGKFTSTLVINADRSFTFSYQGEVWAISGDGLTDKLGESDPERDPREKARAAERAKAEAESRNRALAELLSREAGYRSVSYAGDGKFTIDYQVKGRLDHAFVWPFNLDGEVLIPFLAIELRQGGTVRMKAPAFANDGDKTTSAPGGTLPLADLSSKLDGTFTLDTDAEIVSQNEESGVQAAGNHKRITWRATPALKQAPTAVLRLAPLP